MNNIDKTKTLGQLVAKYPYTADVLNKYKIDYSFKGNMTLEEAIKADQLSEYEVVGELDLSVDEFKLMNTEVIYWENEPIGKILDYILKNHHKYMIKTLNKVDQLFAKVLHEDLREEQETLKKLKRIFEKLKSDMETHQAKEEESLFPLLKEYSENRTKELRDTIVKYMIATENEHDEAGLLFKEINKLTDNFTAPEDSSENYKKIYALLDALEKDTFIHVHMENSILFKMV